MRFVAAVLMAAVQLGCAIAGEPRSRESVVHQMPTANSGSELYSAWFGAARNGVLYFGLSPFWQAMREANGDPTAELQEEGSLLIGRFDLAARRFLDPLRAAPGGHAESIWDVLAHSNGRIYFTTFFGVMGSVAANGSDSQLYPALGRGLNELYEAADGRIFVTRYARQTEVDASGSVVIMDPNGELLEEWALAPLQDTRLAPKSIAVDPSNGEVWINTDTFGLEQSEAVSHETLRLSADGDVLGRWQEPELMMVAFDGQGTGWFAERSDRRLRVRQQGRRGDRSLDLGPIAETDFVQDLSFAPDGEIVLTRWSGRLHVLSRLGTWRSIELSGAGHCPLTGSPALHYTAVLWEGSLFATRHCSGQVVEKRLGHR